MTIAMPTDAEMRDEGYLPISPSTIALAERYMEPDMRAAPSTDGSIVLSRDIGAVRETIRVSDDGVERVLFADGRVVSRRQLRGLGL